MESGEVTSDDGDETCNQQGIYGEDLGVECFFYPLGRIENKHGWCEWGQLAFVLRNWNGAPHTNTETRDVVYLTGGN